ncbi:MAG: hypothetical protein Q8R55_03100, partial [Candidatus Taylorbacteria bacterium]|nr:hypothetical protein [Candidatus Taylorbacteria bacterium]
TPPWVMRWAVTNITPFAATINWTTDEPADGMVEFCTSWVHCGNFTPLLPDYTSEHWINLSNLAPNTRYYFWMYSRDVWGNLRTYGYKTFTTVWISPTMSPTPLPTPAPSLTPWPTPYPSQTPVPLPDTIPPWVTKWSVSGVTPFAATINWTTDEPADGMVEFCTSWVHCGNFTPLVLGYTKDHVINLSGLMPGTRYYFWLYSRDAAGNQRIYGYRTFTTYWTLPTTSPTPLPTPAPTPTPTPTPYPSQTPLPYPDTTPPWVMKWTVTNITTNSVVVDWITDELADGMIEFCTSWVHCANFTPQVTAYTTGHTVQLNGLNSGTRYYFWMYSRDPAGNLRVYGYKTFNTVWTP